MHQAGTNDWFLSREEFDNWKQAKSSLLWLTGVPGSAKTILMSTVINFLQQCGNEKSYASVAYFYCDFRNPDSRDHLNLVGSLIAQICSQLGSFPKDLEEAFERSRASGSSSSRHTNLHAFSEILMSLTSQHRVAILVDALLQWLLCNASNLSLAELHESLAIELDKGHINEEALLESPGDIGDLCPGLIVVTAEIVASLAHLSVRDYLLPDGIKSSRASAFAFSEAEANTENGLSCLAYLSFAELRSGPAGSADDFEPASFAVPSSTMHRDVGPLTLIKPTPLLKNRANTLCSFVVLCSRLTGSRADEYMTTMEQQKHRWDSYPKHATSLYYAASFGLEHLVRALIAQGAEINAAGGRLGATAFHAAALRSHVKVMDILFQKGADPNRADAIKVTPSHSAASMGNAEVIRFLLEHGADPKAKDAWMRTPYDIVRLAGRVDALNYLEIIQPFSC